MDRLYPRIELPITIEQFYTLPQNSAYKYEYWDSRAVLTPRPKQQRAVLDLGPIPKVGEWDVQPLPIAEIMGLAPLFRSAFARQQPFASLDDEACQAAAETCLQRTLDGDGDGPLIPAACFKLFGRHFDGPIGAALVTLEPDDIADNPFAGSRKDALPADALERRLGCPHLTWIFVSIWEARHGAGTRLLAEVVEALLALGYTRLASTFLQGNDSSVYWHWRNGFRLVPWSNFTRIIEERHKQRQANP
jgi:hypothetical protein